MKPYGGMFRENKYSGYGRYVEFFAGDFVKELMGSFMDDEVQGKAKTFYKDGSSYRVCAYLPDFRFLYL